MWSALWATAWLLLLLHWGPVTAFSVRDLGDCVTVAVASWGPYDGVQHSGLWATAWLLLLLHWGRLIVFYVRDYGRLRDCCCSAWLLLLRHWGRMTALCGQHCGRLRDCCCCFIGVLWLPSVSGTWAAAWLLLLLHGGRMTAFSIRDYGRLRDCCCCFTGAVWLCSMFGTMGDCVTAAAAFIGAVWSRYMTCNMLSGLWATAWLLLHWGRKTAFCVGEYGGLRDCCCCFIGAIWLRSMFGTMGDCCCCCIGAVWLRYMTSDMLAGLWAAAWLLLLLHWGRMTVFCVRDYGDCVTAAAASLGPYDCVLCSGLWRMRDCCCCFIGAVWLCSVFGTMATAWLLLLLHWGRMTVFCVRDYGECVTAAAASLGPYDCVLCSGLWRLRDCCCCFIGAVWLCSVFGTMANAWLLLLLHWGRMTVFCVRDYGDCVTAAAASLGPYDCVLCSGQWRLRNCCCCFIGAVWLCSVFGTMATAWLLLLLTGCSPRQATTVGLILLTSAPFGPTTEPLKRGAHCVTAAVVAPWHKPDYCVLYRNRENFVRGAATAWVMLLPAWGRLCAVCWLVCVTDAAAALGAGRVGSVGDLLLPTHCTSSNVPHAVAALCSRTWWHFRVRRFGVDLSWRIDLLMSGWKRGG